METRKRSSGACLLSDDGSGAGAGACAPIGRSCGNSNNNNKEKDEDCSWEPPPPPERAAEESPISSSSSKTRTSFESDEGVWNNPLAGSSSLEWADDDESLGEEHHQRGNDPSKEPQEEQVAVEPLQHPQETLRSRESTAATAHDSAAVKEHRKLSSSFLKPLTNLLNSIRKRYNHSHTLDPSSTSEVVETMGNLQGSDKKGGGHGGGKNKSGEPSAVGSASPGRSRASKLLLGNRGKSPAKQKNKTGTVAAAASAAPQPSGAHGVTADKKEEKAQVTTTTSTGTSGTSVLHPHQHLSSTAEPSRESSAESVFTDPLTSPIANNNNATLAPASGSLTSSYYSDAGTLPDTSSMVRTALEADAVVMPSAGPPTSLDEERSQPPLVVESSLPSSKPTILEDEDDDLLAAVTSELMTRSVDALELGGGGAAKGAAGGAFTLVRHRKVEVPPATLPPEAADLALSDSNLPGSPGADAAGRRHYSVSAADVDPGCVLRKVASLTLDRATLEQKVSRPKAVPQKLEYQIYEKFEGQMLINWFLSAFGEDHYLRLLLTPQDLRILVAQFCTHMLAAGVIRQIVDKDAPLELLFRPDLMYYWAHSEVPAAAPMTPGRLTPSAWPPSLPDVAVIQPAPSRPGARYSEADLSGVDDSGSTAPAKLKSSATSASLPATPAGSDPVESPVVADETSKDDTHTNDIDTEFQQVIMGLKREHRENLSHLSRSQELKLFALRGEQAQKLTEAEERAARLEAQVESLTREVERLRTLADIQQLTQQAQLDFGSPKKEEQPAVPVKSPSQPEATTTDQKESAPSQVAMSSSFVPTTLPSSGDAAPGALPEDAAAVSSPKAASPAEETPSAEIPSSEEKVPSPETESAALPVNEKSQSPTAEVPAPPPPSMEAPQEAERSPTVIDPPPPPMPDAGPAPPPMPSTGPPPPPMPSMGPPPPPMPGIGPPPPPMPGMGPPPPPMPGMGPPPPPMPGMGPPPPPMPGMGPLPPPMPGMGPPPPPMDGMGPPAPPPPPGMGPPALPPPPPGGWTANQTIPPGVINGPVLRKMPVNPPVPMKPLYWTRIVAPAKPPDVAVPEEKLSPGADAPLWVRLEEADIDSVQGEFIDLFSRQIVERKAPKKKAEKPSKQEAVKILDGKRSQRVGILSSSLHLDFTEIEHAIYHFDTSVVNMEALQQIYEVRATSEELEQIRCHVKEKPDVPLDKPEQFLYELAEIPNFAERIACFMFQAEFDNGIMSIDSKLNNIKSTCEMMMTSDSLKTVLSIILALGNYMNGGNRSRGQADGFGLEILAKLRDVKSKDNSITLLHYIVKTYMKRQDSSKVLEMQVPTPEPGDIDRAASVNFEDMENDLKQLQKDLNICQKKAERVITASSEEHLQPFKEKMESFLDKAHKQWSDENENLHEAKYRFMGVMKFYQFAPKAGTKPSEVEPKDFFALWSPFCKDFKDIWKKEQQRMIKERIQEAKRKQEDKMTKVQKVKKGEGGLKAKLQKRGLKTESSVHH